MVRHGSGFTLRFYWILIAAALVVGCDSGTGKMNNKESAVTRIASDTKLNLPKFTSVSEFNADGRTVDETWVAKLQLPLSSKDLILSLLQLKSGVEVNYSGSLASVTPWWNPKDVIIEKRYYADSNTFVVAVLCENGGMLVLYLECAVF